MIIGPEQIKGSILMYDIEKLYIGKPTQHTTLLLPNMIIGAESCSFRLRSTSKVAS